MTARLTVLDASKVAHVTPDEVRAALDSGDLRNLEPLTVEAWARSRVADIVTRSVNP